MPANHKVNEDLNGYIRGAHVDGEEVCPGYRFVVPGSQPDDKGKTVSIGDAEAHITDLTVPDPHLAGCNVSKSFTQGAC